MAYDTQEERLKVRGSEQITRDLKVNRDAFVLGNLEAGEVKSNGDLDVQGELIARNDLSVSGDLYVNGTEHINDTETAQTSDDYLVLRHNKTTALGANEHAGVVVHNYMPNKTATLTTDNTGTWRVADNTETETNYSNISYYNGTYYSGLGQGTTATVIDGIKSAWDEDELSECVFYNNDYYHFDGSNYFEVELSGNVMVLGTMITDPDVITALQALTGYDLVYFRSLSVTTINELENEPLLTRDEASNLSNGHFLSWNSTGNKAVDSGIGASNLATVATSGDYNDLLNKPSITPIDSVTNGNMNPVTSNAVYDYLAAGNIGGGYLRHYELSALERSVINNNYYSKFQMPEEVRVNNNGMFSFAQVIAAGIVINYKFFSSTGTFRLSRIEDANSVSSYKMNLVQSPSQLAPFPDSNGYFYLTWNSVSSTPIDKLQFWKLF